MSAVDLECDEDNQHVVQTPAQMLQWRQKGPLGKLHNINNWIFGSPRRLLEFEELVNRRIPRDNDTRWNSWQAGIEVALSLQRQIEQYILSYSDNKPKATIHDNLLTNDN
jgi:hypothetical protein